MSVFELSILEVFNESHDLPEVVARLRDLSTEESANGHWAANVLTQIDHNSPIAMRLALAQPTHGACDVAGRVFAFGVHRYPNLLRLREAPEGIRAKIVDKDGAPNWHEADLEQAFEQLKTAPYPANQHPLFELN